MPPLSLPVLLACVSLVLLGCAALHDVVARTIPNWIPAMLAMSSLAPVLLSPGRMFWLGGALLLFAGAALCWRRGWLGGGDAKLLGAVGLLVPPERIGGTVMVIGIAGAVLALPYLACRRRIAPAPRGRPAGLAARAWRAERYRLRRGGPLPYGVAIAIGAAFGLLGGTT